MKFLSTLWAVVRWQYLTIKWSFIGNFRAYGSIGMFSPGVRRRIHDLNARISNLIDRNTELSIRAATQLSTEKNDYNREWAVGLCCETPTMTRKPSKKAPKTTVKKRRAKAK